MSDERMTFKGRAEFGPPCSKCGWYAEGAPCQNPHEHRRPDGIYCDCGHGVRCHFARAGR